MDTNLSLLFWLYKSRTNSKGAAPIYLRITINGSRAEISTGQHVAPKIWDSKKGHARGSNDESKVINDHLKIIKNKLLAVHNRLKEQEIPITASGLKYTYLGKDKDAKTLLQAFYSHNKQLEQRVGTDVSRSTFVKYQTIKSKITSYLTEELTRTDILLKELDYQFIMQFELYLKNKEKVSHNTSMRYIKFVKRVINFSLAN